MPSEFDSLIRSPDVDCFWIHPLAAVSSPYLSQCSIMMLLHLVLQVADFGFVKVEAISGRELVRQTTCGNTGTLVGALQGTLDTRASGR